MRISDLPLIQDVKEEYLELRSQGTCRDDTIIKIRNRYSTEFDCEAEDDIALIWIGLADGQWANRELTTDTAKQATNALNYLEQSDWNVTPGDLTRRKTWYAKAPMPEKKIGPKRAKFRCEWKLGDTFAYQLSGPSAEEHDVAGQYVLLRKVSDDDFGDGRLLPVVTLSLWKKPPFPHNTEEYLSSPLLRIASGRFCTPRSVFEYRAEILFRSQKQLKSLPMIYVGNFTDVPIPDDEVIVTGAGNILMIGPECMDDDLTLYIKLSRIYESWLA